MLYSGNATPTSFIGSITTAVGQAFTVADATGWPSGDEFVVLLDQGLATAEKVVCTRSLDVFTTVQRGYDGTTAYSHTDSSVIHPVAAASLNLLDHAADSAWRVPGAAGQPAFQNGWTHNTAYLGLAFRKLSSGLVVVRGCVQGGTNDTTVFILPAGYRVGGDMMFPGRSYTTAWVQHGIFTNAAGDFRTSSLGGNQYVFLDCTFFPDQ